MSKHIVGIQQIGVGVRNAKEAWKWYREQFGMDINVFEDTAVATLMLPHTDGKTCERYAALAVNMEGGGGFEIWQHTGFESRPPHFDVQVGDTGIFICKLKCRNVPAAFAEHHRRGLDILGTLYSDPQEMKHYYVKDPYGNIFEVVHEDYHYKAQKSLTGGVVGAVIGVSDIDKALEVYTGILEYDQVVYDKTGVFEDFAHLPGGDQRYRRVLLYHSAIRTGPFARLLGPTQIELIQPLDRKPKKIFEGRIWGELGYIHLCFDILGMEHLEKECASKGYPFTVNSADSFDMGVAAGHFAYIEDPDGTLIEFVETHKLPIMEKWGWYMNLKGRDPRKSLPNWMINTMAWKRVKDK